MVSKNVHLYLFNILSKYGRKNVIKIRSDIWHRQIVYHIILCFKNDIFIDVVLTPLSRCCVFYNSLKCTADGHVPMG